MLLGFKRRFAPYVEDGSKAHTIRAERKVTPKTGEICHCYVDPRQKTMRLLGRWKCVKVEPIEICLIDESGIRRLEMRISGQELSQDEINELAWRDGFRPVRKCDAGVAMWHYWQQVHGMRPFRGHIIHWAYTKAAAAADGGATS